MSHKQQPHLGNEGSCYHPIRSMRAMTDAGIDPKTAEIVAEQIADAHNKGRREFLDAIEKVCQRFDKKIDKAFAETNKRIDRLEEKMDAKFDDIHKEMRAMLWGFIGTTVTLFGVMIAAFGLFAYIFHS